MNVNKEKRIENYYKLQKEIFDDVWKLNLKTDEKSKISEILRYNFEEYFEGIIYGKK